MNLTSNHDCRGAGKISTNRCEVERRNSSYKSLKQAQFKSIPNQWLAQIKVLCHYLIIQKTRLQSTVQHGVGTSIAVQWLLVFQLHRMFGIEPEEVNEFCSSVNLSLDHSLTLSIRKGFSKINGKPACLTDQLTSDNS